MTYLLHIIFVALVLQAALHWFLLRWQPRFHEAVAMVIEDFHVVPVFVRHVHGPEQNLENKMGKIWKKRDR